MSGVLLGTLCLPLATALLLGRKRKAARRLALGAVVLTLIGAATLVLTSPADSHEFAAIDVPWVAVGGAPLDIRLSVGLDGWSLWLFMLTAVLMLPAVLVDWETIRQQATLYYRLLLALETGMLGIFVARDVVLFCIFWQFTLTVLLLLIGIFGGEGRRPAAIRFFLFTFCGSMVTLLGLLVIVFWDYSHPIGDPATWKMTFSIPELTEHLAVRPMDPVLQTWVFCALAAGFLVTTAMVPLHRWLPAALTEAPIAIAVLLAGVLLKIGVYGLLRFALPMLPQPTATWAPWLLWLSAAGVVYGAVRAVTQTDVRRFVAYWSVSQLGLCMLGLFALNRLGTRGAVLLMLSHGLAAGGILALAGMLYRRHGTWRTTDLAESAHQTPRLALLMLVVVFCAIGVPGLSGFVGQLLPLLGMFQCAAAVEAVPALATQYRVIAALAVAGAAVPACYMLYLVSRALLVAVRRSKDDPEQSSVDDLAPREILALAPLLLWIVWIGLQPQLFLGCIGPARNRSTPEVQQAVACRWEKDGTRPPTRDE